MMARMLVGVAHLSGWVAGACFVLALLAVPNVVRADQSEDCLDMCGEEPPQTIPNPNYNPNYPIGGGDPSPVIGNPAYGTWAGCYYGCLNGQISCATPPAGTCVDDNSTTPPIDCTAATKGQGCDAKNPKCKCRFSRTNAACTCGL
jgi:hypothetical protein